ncbi:MAG: bifunctional diaminohydroxyphosphoribosylaminopyrimidine deaminase/5-amino-6-(5-phosphoribosylamino)uracil reductase RibD [Actinomycetes bacterium]
MRRALVEAASSDAPLGPNPRVGCVILRPDGTTISVGHHRGAGTPHAEVDALRGAGEAAAGATVVVTLEPCHHTGRTGPCTAALIRAQVARVVVGQRDVSPVAAGGVGALRAAGVDVEVGVLSDEARALNPCWTTGAERGRPVVTWKVAASLDGRVAAVDGTSRWITGPVARADGHRLRATVDAVIVGTGTVLADDPRLTARPPEGLPVGVQPLRVVVGERSLPANSAVLDDSAPTRVFHTHEVDTVLDALGREGHHHVLLEGGPTLAAAFLRAGLVDRVVAYVAPVLLGAGSPALSDFGVDTIGDAERLVLEDVTRFGDDVRITATLSEES